MEKRAEEILRQVFCATLDGVMPDAAVRNKAGLLSAVYERRNLSKCVVVGFGKAACRMAKALMDSLPCPIREGILITKYGYSGDITFDRGDFQVYEAGHPIPDARGLTATGQVMELLRIADDRTLVICLISGGGSALLVAPYKGITLEAKQTVTDLLMKAGAEIRELNTVRKHISQVKGGRLAELAYPASVVSLILSDVIGNAIDVIASGPTSPDGTTYRDAISVLEKYNLTDRVPEIISSVLREGLQGFIPDTPKAGDVVFERVENIIIGNNNMAISAAERQAEQLGLSTRVLTDSLAGEARRAGEWLAEKGMETKRSLEGTCGRPVCLISGGETTVTVKGNGIGGRNMELALAFALAVEGTRGLTLLSAGTDGTDGPTDAAGAVVDGCTARCAREKALDPQIYLDNNDAYGLFQRTGNLIRTGPTGTNVMDVQIILVE
jgi:glycerate 2-kinase